MVTTQWKIRPPLDAPRDGVWLGPGKPGTDGLWLGNLAEVAPGRSSSVWLSTPKEQVIAVVGKRGSGKSFTLGVIAEGLSSSDSPAISQHTSQRAVLLFDPLDVYWTTRYGVAESENPEAQRHFQMANAAGLTGASFDVRAWVPGRRASREADPDWFETLQLRVSSLGLDEWEILLGINMMNEPMGQALGDALTLVSKHGYVVRSERVEPTEAFGLPDLVESLKSNELESSYHPESLRALRQRLAALESTGLFDATGTTIREMLAPGRISVVLLGRLGHSYRSAVVAVLTRMLIEERSNATFAEKRLALDPELDAQRRGELEASLVGGVPRTVVMLDEAQSFLAPGEQNPARALFVRLVKEGRNLGLSAVLATQQPSAIDRRVLSQVETFVAHQLVTEPDIRAVRENLKSDLPTSSHVGAREVDFSGLLRQLPPGYCVVSAADMNVPVRRCVVVHVRPRATVHGGIEL